MIKKLVSIIIPCFNDKDFIIQSVNSALNQSYPFVEIIVVDDGSNNETKNVLKKIKSQITILITQDNKGPSAARNAGIKVAKGEYIFVLDSDDYVEPTFCEKAVNIFVKNSETKIVSCYAKLIYDNKPSELFKPEGGLIYDFLFKNAVLGSLMFKKNDWNQVGGYDEAMKKGWEDWEFYIRLLKNGGNAAIIDEPLFNYRKRDNSTTSIANNNRFILYSYVLNKHKDLYKEHFDKTVSFLLGLAENNIKNEHKRLNSLDYRIGNTILKPFRIIRKLLK